MGLDMKRVIALASLTALTTGCNLTAIQAQSRVNPVSLAVYRSSDKSCPSDPKMPTGRFDAVNLDCFRFPEDRQDENGPLAYADAVTSPADRDRLIAILMKQSDEVCVLEMGKLTANEALTNSVLSTASTALSAAATIVSGELAKSILSGVAGVAGSTRDHINVHVYRNTIAQAVSQTISAQRAIVAGEITAKYGLTTAAWSIDEGIRRVNEYHGICSFYKGLELLLKAADDKTSLQSYRAAAADAAQLGRLNTEIADYDRTIASEAAAKDPVELVKLKERRNALIDKRSRIGTGPEVAVPAPGPTPQSAGQ